jgi:tetratricopeptide (TPR) repeat protein
MVAHLVTSGPMQELFKKPKFLIIGILAAVGTAGAVYFRSGDNREAKRDLSLNKARGYLKQAKVEDAVSEFRNALKADPKSAEGHYELGLALLKLGERRNALREFQSASNLKPDMMQPRYQLAHLYLVDRDVMRAKEQLAEIQRHDQDSVEVRQMVERIAWAEMDPDQAIKEIAEALKREPRSAGLYLDLASSYVRKKEFKTAEGAYKKALEIEPTLIQARIELLRLYQMMGEQALAEQELILATRADPENENLLHFRPGDYAGTRKFDEFEGIYLDLLKKKPDSLMAKKRLAEFYILKGDLGRGWTYTHEIEKARPGDADAIYFFGRLHLAQKEWARAAEVFRLATRNSPNFAFAYYFLGLARLENKEIAPAQTALTKALELSPTWLEPRTALARIHLITGEYDLALQESESILRAQPDNADALKIAGVARLKKGEITQALELLKRAKILLPGDANLFFNMGEGYLTQRKYGQALIEYEETLKLDPDRIDALVQIAKVLSAQGNEKGAFKRVEQQLSKTKNKAELNQLLGQLSLNEANYEKALGYLEKAVALKPDLFSAAHLIATIYVAQKKFDQAIAASEKIIQKNPKATSSYLLLGVLHDQKQQHDRANRYYQKVIDLDKNSALAANSLARNYAQYGGNLDVAMTLAQKARELSPEDEGIADTLGWIYYKKGAYLMAIGLLKESSDKFKDRNPTVLYHLGMAYSKSGDNPRAKEVFSKALRLGQDFGEAKEAVKALEEIQAKRS